MPAIPVYARLEAHFTDAELLALLIVTGELVHSLAAAQASHPRVRGEQLSAATTLHVAIDRTIAERQLSA